MSLRFYSSLILLSVFLSSCQKETPIDTPKLIFKFQFDPSQERLDNFGMPQTIPSSHAAQTPTFNLMGVHYLELSTANSIPAYQGNSIYESPKTNKGGAEAIDFEQALYAGDGETFYTKSLNAITPGSYSHLRISLSYQNYTINFRAQNQNLTGTIASFVGANTYIDSYQVKDQIININGNKLQGYWGFETDFPNIAVIQGQAPPGATTVPNPIQNFSPIPAGSCLVTGNFERPLVIKGNETSDIIINCSISINNSFEWEDKNGNGTFEPTEGDVVIDMGVRGLIPRIE